MARSIPNPARPIWELDVGACTNKDCNKATNTAKEENAQRKVQKEHGHGYPPAKMLHIADDGSRHRSLKAAVSHEEFMASLKKTKTTPPLSEAQKAAEEPMFTQEPLFDTAEMDKERADAAARKAFNEWF